MSKIAFEEKDLDRKIQTYFLKSEKQLHQIGETAFQFFVIQSEKLAAELILTFAHPVQ